MNYIFEDDGNVSEVIGALDIIHHLDKIAHTTQSIYKWIMYRKYGNINQKEKYMKTIIDNFVDRVIDYGMYNEIDKIYVKNRVLALIGEGGN